VCVRVCVCVVMDLLGSVVAANPCPPLPLLVNRTDSKTGRPIDGFGNTHHVLMQAYSHAMQRGNEKANAERMATQTALTEVLMQAFHADGPATAPGAVADPDPLPNPEALYTACTTFTRNYLHAFMPDRPVPDARFAAYDDVSTDSYGGNPIVRASCEHLAGMIYYDEGGTRPFEDVLAPLKRMQFSGVLCKYGEVHRARAAATAVANSVEELD